jgi:hypothetical protein
MRTIAKAVLGALALASAGAMVATPANARGPHVGFSIGVGPYYPAPYYGYDYPYRPYYGYGYDYPYYGYGPSISFGFGGGHHHHGYWRR